MTTLHLRRIFLTAVLATLTQTTLAQTAQLGGGGNAGGGAGQAAAGTTTAGAGGVTTQGVGANTTGGEGGFIGGNAAEAFVGGGVVTDRNGNRSFQSFTPSAVPTGTNRNATGTPRTIRTQLRIGFSFPKPDAYTALIGQSGPPIRQVVSIRPEFQNVSVIVNQAGLATLAGSVPNISAKRLAANLIRLRPGIRKIDNRLAVATGQDVGTPIPMIPAER